MYRRTKLLYDADVVDSVASVAQCLIFLSLWSEGGTAQRDAWYWANCLTSLIEKTEPWRNIGWSSTATMSPVLWWCCLARETHVALVVRRPPRMFRLHKYVPCSMLQDYATIIGDKTSNGNPLLRMRAASCLTLTARLVTTIARILHNDFADMPGTSDQKNAVFESCERELIDWSHEFLGTFPATKERLYRSNRETGPFFIVSLLLHDTAINALYLHQVLKSHRAHSSSNYKIPQYKEKMRRAATRTAVLITEAFESEWRDTIPTQL